MTGHEDPAGEAPWAMQLVVRVERADPPTHTAVCEAAAGAVVTLLDDARCTDGGEWEPPVGRWLGGRIRKHVRRARGAAWDKVQELPGITVRRNGAEVRALVPCATDLVPREVAKLQLQGLDLKDPGAITADAPDLDGPVVIGICPDPVLPTGKAAAAAGHAAQLARMAMDEHRLGVWRDAGFPVRVVHPPVQRWAALRDEAQLEIVDAGFTVVAPLTTTAVARWA